MGVLLSVAGDLQHVTELADSIDRQEDVSLKVYWRRDGSVTPGGALAELAARPAWQELGSAEHWGLPRTYFTLIENAPPSCDYYAFADQDDVWHPCKLTTAVGALAGVPAEVPALWVSRVSVFGSYRFPGVLAREFRPSLGNALVQNIAPGCAMVWNAALHEQLRARLPGYGPLMHDAWVYLVASATGTVLTEEAALVRYRIHGANAVGLADGWWSRVGRFLRLEFRGGASLESQAASLLASFGDQLDADQSRLVRLVAGGPRLRRAEAVLRGHLTRHGGAEDLALLVRMLARPRSGLVPRRELRGSNLDLPLS